jgi:hypothetical protein
MMWRSRYAALALISVLVVTGQAATVSKVNAAPRGPTTVVFSTSQSRFDAGVDNQGWWSMGQDGSDSNDNYIAGSTFITAERDHRFRNFFTFDVNHLGKHVESATLRVNSGAVSGLSGSEVLRLSDVSTDAATLNTNDGPNADIYRDLGTGTVYGDYPVGSVQDNEPLTLELNKAALRDLKHTRGGYFSVGGSLMNARLHVWIFGDSQDLPPAELVVRTR